MSKEPRSQRRAFAPAFLGGGDGRERSGQRLSGAGVEARDRPGPKMGPAGDERERSGSGSSGSSYGGKGKSPAGSGSSKASFQRSNSHDKVRKIVAQEGRAARNLIAWSVPLENKDDDGKSKTHISGKTRETVKSQRSALASQRVIKQAASTEKSSLSTVGEKSPTKGRQPRKIDLRARYWAFLFDNLRRAVDEIYVTCESDQSVVECKEVLMMLDNYVRDFKALIDWLQLQEKLENTDAQNRPTSLAWEVRKMSPGRHVMPSPPADRICTTSSARRSLNFGAPSTMAAPPALVAARLAPTGVSWADKVKANRANTVAPKHSRSNCQKSSQRIRLHPNDAPRPAEYSQKFRFSLPIPGVRSTFLLPHLTVFSPVIHPVAERKDTEGWETVQRGRATRSRSATMAANASAKPSEAVYLSLKDDSDKENGLSVSQNSKINFEQSSPSSESMTDTPEKLISRNEDTSMDIHKHTANMSADPAQPDNVPLQDKSWQQETDAIENKKDVNCLSEDVKVEVIPVISVQEPTPSDTPRLGPDVDLSSELSNQSMAAVLAKGEELANRLEKENEEAIANAIAEEEQLTREIQAEENNDINLEADTESEFSASMGSGSLSLYGVSSQSQNLDWNDVLADYEAREPWRQSTSWGDIVEEEPARPPGHAIQMHEKLSSPSRKMTIAESKKKHEEKQLKAQQLREKLREEQTLKLQKLLEREKEVRKWKEELLEQRRKMMEEKLLHAELKRELQLQAIVKKAQEEEAKVNEIAFINTLEAQNKRHDVLAKLKEYEQRLNELQEERHRRQEEKQARDEAVQERKRALEAERQARVEELMLKRREQEARIEQQRQEKEKAREDAARERAREREERLAALSAAQQEAMEELQKKIQQKHDESSRRHMEQIEQRKEKAAELSSGRHANTDYAPKLTPYERKKHCSLCNVLITSEVYLFSHIKGRKHQQAVRENSSIQGRELSDEEVEHLSCKKYITDIVTETCVHLETTKDAEEKQKVRKKAKKLRTRMNSRGKEYESSLEARAQIPDSPFKAKLQRLVKDLLKQQQGQDSGPWANNKVSSLDRTLGEINRILEKQNNADQIGFQVGGGLSALEQILHVVNTVSSPNIAPRIPVKSLCNVINAYCFACKGCYDNCVYVLFSNKITFLLELLMHQLTLFVPAEDEAIFGKSVSKQVFEGLTTGLLQTCATVLGCLASNLPEASSQPGTPKKSGQETKNNLSQSELCISRIQDLISYVVYTGLTDRLYGCFLSIQGPVDEQPKIASFLQNVTALLHSMCRLCFAIVNRSQGIFENKRQDPTGLITALQSTELVGVLNMLYCILLHGTVPDHTITTPAETYPQHTIHVAIQSLRFLNSFAFLDLPTFQAVCGAEGLSLAFRHIVSSLLWYCYHHTCEDLLHEVIVCVGYFTVNHPDNQVTVQSGRHPTVLQKLCQLPFQYFSDQRLIKVLFPTLITACYNNPQNKVILEQEMSCILLATFIQDFAQSLNQSDNKPAQQREKAPVAQDYLEFSNRFPRELWENAQKFFLNKETIS
ncbi:S phase cyclin A-associated protein in the endoplasmic reticulum isoform X1 [Scyliorhinus canicula]|uniref:S phase cyclin A-associated protein in the endoplasmic reticulum isoform X1 n=1 Tax=Scyliorhinus canicula TaxID=7830 RepID=UPI0018F568BF|nr:S phase cyclin A-associated protein in the endoplasmic reticulum isoform X1 [Scyliorhinus canicula]